MFGFITINSGYDQINRKVRHIYILGIDNYF